MKGKELGITIHWLREQVALLELAIGHLETLAASRGLRIDERRAKKAAGKFEPEPPEQATSQLAGD
jgi:hypothetical protein